MSDGFIWQWWAKAALKAKMKEVCLFIPSRSSSERRFTLKTQTRKYPFYYYKRIRPWWLICPFTGLRFGCLCWTPACLCHKLSLCSGWPGRKPKLQQIVQRQLDSMKSSCTEWVTNIDLIGARTAVSYIWWKILESKKRASVTQARQIPRLMWSLETAQPL